MNERESCGLGLEYNTCVKAYNNVNNVFNTYIVTQESDGCYHQKAQVLEIITSYIALGSVLLLKALEKRAKLFFTIPFTKHKDQKKRDYVLIGNKNMFKHMKQVMKMFTKILKLFYT